MSHLATAGTCKWYRKGKNVDYSSIQTVETSTSTESSSSVDDNNAFGGLEDIMEDRDLFRFVLPSDLAPECASQGQVSSSSSIPAQGTFLRPHQRVLALDDDEDSRVEEEDPRHGRVIRMSQTVVETWKAFFAQDLDDEDRMDIDEEGVGGTQGSLDRWKPFASELDWRVAMWAVREDVGQNALNRLLSIPGVSLYTFS